MNRGRISTFTSEVRTKESGPLLVLNLSYKSFFGVIGAFATLFETVFEVWILK